MKKEVYATLRKKLTAIFAMSTGAILAAALIVVVIYSKWRNDIHDREALFHLITTFSDEMNNTMVISHENIHMHEKNENCLIVIEDNGKPLGYDHNIATVDDYNELVESLKKLAESELIFSDMYPLGSMKKSSSIFELTGRSGSKYLGGITQITNGSNWLNVLIISPVKHFSYSVYAAILVVGLSLLYLAGYLLVGVTLKPLAEADKKQTEFIAAASHELRSPMAVIKANLDLLELDTSHNTVLESVSDMNAELTRMNSLVENMLNLASMDASARSGWKCSKSEVNLDTFLLNLYEEYDLFARTHGMKLNLKLPEHGNITVSTDPEKLHQILTVFFDNAFAYAKGSESIDITLNEDSSIVFADHGPGIPEEKKKDVFLRFNRGDKSRKEKNHFGLGLSIADELAGLLDVTIQLTDTVGGGCTFKLIF